MTAYDFIAGGDEFQRTTVVGGNLRREFSTVIICKQMEGEADFFQVAHAFNPSGPGFGLVEDGQQKCSKNSNDRDDDQKFHQSERTDPAIGWIHFHGLKII